MKKWTTVHSRALQDVTQNLDVLITEINPDIIRADHYQPFQTPCRHQDLDLPLLPQQRSVDQNEGCGVAGRLFAGPGPWPLLQTHFLCGRGQGVYPNEFAKGPPPAVERLAALRALQRRRDMHFLPLCPPARGTSDPISDQGVRVSAVSDVSQPLKKA